MGTKEHKRSGLLVLTMTSEEPVYITIPPGETWRRVKVGIGDVRGRKVRVEYTTDRTIQIDRAGVLDDTKPIEERRKP